MRAQAPTLRREEPAFLAVDVPARPPDRRPPPEAQESTGRMKERMPSWTELLEDAMGTHGSVGMHGKVKHRRLGELTGFGIERVDAKAVGGVLCWAVLERKTVV